LNVSIEYIHTTRFQRKLVSELVNQHTTGEHSQNFLDISGNRAIVSLYSHPGEVRTGRFQAYRNGCFYVIAHSVSPYLAGALCQLTNFNVLPS